jgi:hypothetical protein
MLLFIMLENNVILEKNNIEFIMATGLEKIKIAKGLYNHEKWT